MEHRLVFAGFGGQGVLSMGMLIAYSGMMEDKQVSWLPSYGPEMRGGTANCSVIISDGLIGSPIVTAPDVLVAMNLPSLDKFERAVKPGGTIYVDSSLTARKVERTDVTAVYIPATRLASENALPNLANMVMMGKVLAGEDKKLIEKALVQAVSAKRGDMIELNMRAFSKGESL